MIEKRFVVEKINKLEKEISIKKKLIRKKVFLSSISFLLSIASFIPIIHNEIENTEILSSILGFSLGLYSIYNIKKSLELKIDTNTLSEELKFIKKK
ncbi:MAG: hypothetical protein RSB00_01475 [Bacilli bacterium]